MSQAPTPEHLSIVKGKPNKADVYCVVATVKKVFAQKTGTAQSGQNAGSPYHIQNLQIVQDGIEMLVMVDGHETPVPSSYEGRVVMFEAWNGDRGWSGLKVIDEEYPRGSGVITRKLKVTKTGRISLADGAAAPTGPPAQSPAPISPSDRRPSPSHTDHPRPVATLPEPFAERPRNIAPAMVQIFNVQCECICGVINYMAPLVLARTGYQLTPDDIRCWSMNAMIDLSKCGYIGKASTERQDPKDFKKVTPPPPDPPPGQPEWDEDDRETGEPRDPVTGEFTF